MHTVSQTMTLVSAAMKKGFISRHQARGREKISQIISFGLCVFKGKGSGCEICWLAIEIRGNNTLSGHAHSGIMPLHGRHVQIVTQWANEENLWVYPHRGYFPLLGPFCSTARTLSSWFIYLNSSYWVWANFLQKQTYKLIKWTEFS